MGSVARCIKRAGLGAADDQKQQFTERLSGIETSLKEAPATGDADVARMEAPIAQGGFNLPSAKSETMRSALKWLAISGGTALTAGVMLRLLRASGEAARRHKITKELDPYAGMPGREIHVPISTKKGGAKEAAVSPWLAGLAVTAPAAARATGSHISDVAGKAWEKTKEVGEKAWAPSGRAIDAPWFLPAAALSTVAAGYLGYHGLDKVLDALRARRTRRTLAKAKREFEQALQVQHQQGALAGETGTKYSSLLGELVDVVANAHVSGELAEQIDTLVKAGALDPTQTQRKWWHGSAGAATGGYLALMAVLGSLALGGGYTFAKGREVKRRKHEAARELLRRRRLAEPPRVTVEATPSNA